MAIEITMPALSPTMEEGNLASWAVKVGDKVEPGDVIAEIETDKATMEVEAVDEGVIAEILVEAGTEGVKVNAVIALLAEEGEDPADVKGGGGSKSADAAPQKDLPDPEKAAARDDAKVSETSSDGGAGHGKPQPATSASGGKTDVPDSVKAGPAPTKDGERIFSTPLARRVAQQKGIDLSSLAGSGPRGRIVLADVESAKPSEAAKATDAPKGGAAAAAPVPMADDAVLKLFEEGSYELVKHDGMRKTIAKRLVQAKQTVPHFYLTRDVNIDALLKLRSQINKSAPMTKTDDGEKPAYKLSVNDMIIKAMAMALQAVPDANASWTEEAMVKHKYSDVGVAVAIPGGLITPIIRKAEQKTLSAISNEMKDMATRARDRKLKPEEYQGGTTAVSNLGMFGIKHFSAVINPPHGTILAVGAGEKRPIVKDDAVAIAMMMTVTLSVDHRAVDGALGAELLDAFHGFVENPMSMLV
ncbi:pyruvate dehydrogenase complex dihydrolipoamide acetyltransferase [Notoacmeibacter sp. MSK16QG-6]|uniref:pyruvate dehydrogenase complex dihydrolipoamide acetyltransferase n=1 Tax=Notoacmeibacter sp. MSK16QG-6 TaxID=2957982 RepID=UPI00209CAD60|nr:pyruvate dehydrogenase complex dihydrolipoamide acetyltransferase [Notoacmeibacter sp. MSK16QG-6]MCP1200769.1 pyruvate dehydrogenase complex dihydrolipoamide acetyltransferase [Notoacmeibacter sp. MSK16QG-6]